MSLPPRSWIVSFPSPPVIVLTELVPISVSLKADPVRFSNPLRVSVPAPPVFCGMVFDRSTVTEAEAWS